MNDQAEKSPLNAGAAAAGTNSLNTKACRPQQRSSMLHGNFNAAAATTTLTATHELGAYTPGCCDGATMFLVWTAAAITVFVVVPLIIYFTVDDFPAWALAVWLLAAPVAALTFTCATRRTLFFPQKAPLEPLFASESTPLAGGVQNAIVIFNPHGGTRRAAAIVAALTERTKERVEWTLWPTKSQGHAKRMCEAVSDWTRYDALFVVGGDGTLHEVVNGILSPQACAPAATAPPIGLLPGGSGNSVARDLGRRAEAHTNVSGRVVVVVVVVVVVCILCLFASVEFCLGGSGNSMTRDLQHHAEGHTNVSDLYFMFVSNLPH
jgi:hypothetical protein